jgi:F-box protein 25/32
LIGSDVLWQRHMNMLQQMQTNIEQSQIIDEHMSNNDCTFECLPIEIYYEILRRLDNGLDLIHIGMSNSNFYRVIDERMLWRQLCVYHFLDRKIDTRHCLDRLQLHDDHDIDWKRMFFKLKRSYGLRQVYAEIIRQCQSCKTLFWQVNTNDAFLVDNRCILRVNCSN